MRRHLVAALLALFVPAAVVSAQAPVPEVASSSLSSSELSFRSLVSADSWSLTVTGPNDFARTVQSSGQPPVFSIYDHTGYPVADGLYKYELTASSVPLRMESAQSIARSDPERAQALAREGRSSGPRAGSHAASLPALSGHFRISGGQIQVPTAMEERPIMMPGARGGSRSAAPGGVPEMAGDQVILDDLIVDGSICVGLDCVNGESFGFDTIRLKENNTRIRAVDTSNSASFPTFDWQITFNESSNGGLNKFAIEDLDSVRTPFTIEGGADANSLYVDTGGRIGFGTAAPVVELHVKDGDTPTLRLEQDGSSGFTPQTWDVAGNETNFFVRDATNGSTLPFRIRPSAPSSSVDIFSDKIRIGTNTQNVGIGTQSPASAFHVSRTGLVLPIFESSNGDAVQFRIKSDSTNRRIVALNNSDAVQSQIVMGDSGNFTFLGPTGTDIRATLNSTGLDVVGQISLSGVPYTHPDYVFEADYDLPSIDEQAEYMWANKHLPAVGPGTYDEAGRSVLDLGAKTLGMLEELEKAHLYISQLNTTVRQLNDTIESLRERLARLESQDAGDSKQ